MDPQLLASTDCRNGPIMSTDVKLRIKRHNLVQRSVNPTGPICQPAASSQTQTVVANTDRSRRRRWAPDLPFNYELYHCQH